MVCPAFIGRLDDISSDGMELIEQILTIYENYEFSTQFLVASVRHPQHVVEAALLGGHICTMTYSVFQQLVKHPLTDIGLKKFLADWESQKASQKITLAEIPKKSDYSLSASFFARLKTR